MYPPPMPNPSVTAGQSVAAMAAVLAAQQQQHSGGASPAMAGMPWTGQGYGGAMQNGVMNPMQSVVQGMMGMGLNNVPNFSQQARPPLRTADARGRPLRLTSALLQTSPFIGNPALGGFSPALGVSNPNGGLSPNPAQSGFTSPMLGGFSSPNMANFANFPSPALSQGSFGGLPSGTGGFAQNGMQMQQMMGLGLQGTASSPSFRPA